MPTCAVRVFLFLLVEPVGVRLVKPPQKLLVLAPPHVLPHGLGAKSRVRGMPSLPAHASASLNKGSSIERPSLRALPLSPCFASTNKHDLRFRVRLSEGERKVRFERIESARA
jgi:hypothetical protein